MAVSVVVAHICLPVTEQHQMLVLWDDSHTFYCIDYFVFGRICTCFGVFIDSMFQQISSNSCLLSFLLVQSRQAETILVKRFMQGRNNVTRVGVKPRSCNQERRRNDTFTHLAMLLTITEAISMV